MNNKEILANAPDGATHVEVAEDGVFYYRKGEVGYESLYKDEWRRISALSSYVRSLADIARIAELENIINAQVFPSSGDGFSSEYIKGYEKALSDLDKILKEQE